MDSYFASVEAVRDLERAECDLLLEVAGVIAAQREGVVTKPIAGGVAVWAGDGAPLNKIAGMGFERLPTPAELDDVEAIFFEHGARAQAEIASHADIALGKLLTRRGYVLGGMESVLVYRTERAPSSKPAPGVVVEEATDFDEWLDTLVKGFVVPDGQGINSPETREADTLRAVIAEMAGCATMKRYIARRDGEPAGAADMRVGGGMAQLCGAATLPAHRKRGVQTALLQHRIDDAAASGCGLLVVSTLPGSKSQQNVQRHGFEPAYTKAMLFRDPD